MKKAFSAVGGAVIASLKKILGKVERKVDIKNHEEG